MSLGLPGAEQLLPGLERAGSARIPRSPLHSECASRGLLPRTPSVHTHHSPAAPLALPPWASQTWSSPLLACKPVLLFLAFQDVVPSHSSLASGRVVLWCVPLAVCHTRSHTPVLKLSSPLPVSEVTLLLHVLRDPSIRLRKESARFELNYVVFPLHVLKPQRLGVSVPPDVGLEMRPLQR